MMATEKYCAFLRGVNVKGTAMKMQEVCSVFAGTGMKEVSAVLASGNIIFSTSEDKISVKKRLEKSLSQHFNYDAHLFIKNYNEIENIIRKNPFEKLAQFHVYAFIIEEDITQMLMEQFEQSQSPTKENAIIENSIFYWQVLKGSTLESGFGKILGRRDLKDQFSTRNMNTLEKIIKKMLTLIHFI